MDLPVVRHRKTDTNDGAWDEFEMKHCLDPSRPRAYYGDVVPALQASGQDPRDMARHSDSIQVSGCMRYVTVEVGLVQTILIGFG